MQQNATNHRRNIEVNMNNDYSYIIHNNGDLSKKDQSLAKELFPVSTAREARKFARFLATR